MILVLIGAPGAGKGTQAGRIARSHNLHHLSTGDLLRNAAAGDTVLGRQAMPYLGSGELVPDEVILGIVRQFLIEHPGGGVLFDGFPRTVAQAEGLDQAAKDEPVRALLISVPDGLVVQRLTSRQVCRNCGRVYNPALGIMPPQGDRCECGGELHRRDDDHPEAVAQRLAVYKRETEPLVDYYRRRGVLVEVDGSGTPDEVFERIKGTLGDPA